MGTLICPYCDSEVKLSLVEAEEGCCPECGSAISTDAVSNDDYDEDDDNFDDIDDDSDEDEDEEDEDDSDEDEEYEEEDDDDDKYV